MMYSRRLSSPTGWDSFIMVTFAQVSHMRMVAPIDPVPLRRNTTREPSTIKIRIPCREDTDPSTGSLYSNSSAFATENPVTIGRQE